MKAKNTAGKIYVSFKAYLGRSETFCRGFVEGNQLQIILMTQNTHKHFHVLEDYYNQNFCVNLRHL